MANEHDGHRSRLRDRVRKDGIENFQNYQVLEYALTFAIPYKDTNVIAHRLINKFGSFAGVLEADEEDIASVEGMGEVSAHYLANLLKIYHYYEKDKVNKNALVDKPQLAVEYVRQFLVGKLIEEVYVVCVTPQSKVQSVEKISEGTANSSTVSLRKIQQLMNKTKVNSVIVAHNHPRGDVKPSADDDKFTKGLIMSLELSGCHLIDHVIIGEGEEYYSYRQENFIDEYIKEIAHMIQNKVAQPMPRYIVEGKRHD